MTTITVVLMLGTLLMMCPSSTFAQRLLLVGEGGYEYSLERNGAKMPGNAKWFCPVGQDGGHQHRAWAGLGLSTELANSTIDLELRTNFAYSDITAGFILHEAQIVYPVGDSFASMSSDVGLEYQLWTTAMQLDFTARLGLAGGLHLESGILSSYRLGYRLTQRYHFSELLEARLSSFDREKLSNAVSLDASESPFSTSVMLGLSYDIPIYGMVGLRPTARVRHNLNDAPLTPPTMFNLGMTVFLRNSEDNTAAGAE